MNISYEGHGAERKVLASIETENGTEYLELGIVKSLKLGDARAFIFTASSGEKFPFDSLPELESYAQGVRPHTISLKDMASEPRLAFDFASHNKMPFPAGEAAIATSPQYAYHYAAFILKAPFPAGEAAIATNPVLSYRYAHNVLHGRFPAGEKAINASPAYASIYKTFLKSLDSSRKKLELSE